jgi:hypothetical protein
MILPSNLIVENNVNPWLAVTTGVACAFLPLDSCALPSEGIKVDLTNQMTEDQSSENHTL